MKLRRMRWAARILGRRQRHLAPAEEPSGQIATISSEDRVANFGGIPLVTDSAWAGALLSLREASPIDAIERLPGGVEVEIRAGANGIVVRGLSDFAPDVLLANTPELANQALDLLGMRNHFTLALKDTVDRSVVWWRDDSGQNHMRVYSIATLRVGLSATIEVRDADGNIVEQPGQATSPWHESMRYFRMSQVTDDLFDAFRNVYLALESLLSRIEPVRLRPNGRPAEGEGDWLKRALAAADNIVPLRDFQQTPAAVQDPVDETFTELYTKIRTAIFHAKNGRPVLLPQDFANRAMVEDAKGRYARLYLALADRELKVRFPAGGLTKHAAEMMAAGVFNDASLAVTADGSPATREDERFSPLGESISQAQAQRALDLDTDFEKFIRATLSASDLGDTAEVGRFGAMNSEGTVMIIESLDGRLSFPGLDSLELVIGLRVGSQSQPKTRYGT